MVVDFGVLPEPGAGPGVFVGVAARRFRLEVGGVLLLARTAMVDEAAGKGAELDLIAASAGGCYLPFDTEPRLGACAGIEGGQLRGESFGVLQPGRGSADWLAARAGALAGFQLSGRLELIVQADATLRIGEQRFTIGGLGDIHQPSAYGARLGLGLEHHFK